ncbi:MAG: CehA/McbA family metallohydrolase [bacterium]
MPLRLPHLAPFLLAGTVCRTFSAVVLVFSLAACSAKRMPPVTRTPAVPQTPPAAYSAPTPAVSVRAAPAHSDVAPQPTSPAYACPKPPVPKPAIPTNALTQYVAAPNAAVSDKKWAVYFGDLHTHCDVSDGKGTPEEAYSYARDVAKVDFLALTDHNKAKLTPDAVKRVIRAADKVRTPAFAPLLGQEFSTDDNGNHINVYGIEEPIPEAINNDFRRLYREWMPAYTNRHPGSLVFCQFNHPESRNRDYGVASVSVKAGLKPNYAGDWDTFVADAGRWVKLISVVSGPATGKEAAAHGLHKDIKDKLGTWFFYLDKGLRLAPTCNQDTHSASWGDHTTGRTGVWLDGPLNRNALMRSLSEGRCFATEDKNLSLWFELGGAPMGARLADMGTTNLPVVVKVSDRDETNSNYSVELYRDTVGDGKPASVFVTGTVSSGGTYTNVFRHTQGVNEVCLAHIKQVGTDDDAWSAAVFIGGPDAGKVPDAVVNKGALINLNSASKADLKKLPGIGDKLADGIIAARPFVSKEDVKRVNGIKDGKYRAFEAQIEVETEKQ